MSGSSLFRTVAHCFRTIVPVVIDLIRLAILAVHSRRALAAENLFLRKQLALFQERQVTPRRANDSARWMMATLSRMFPWRDALVNVKASTLIRWHRQGFRLFWRWKSKPMGVVRSRRSYKRWRLKHQLHSRRTRGLAARREPEEDAQRRPYHSRPSRPCARAKLPSAAFAARPELQS